MLIFVVFISPLPVLILAAYILPMLGILTWSFSSPTLGMQNYSRIYEDPYIIGIFTRTVRICLSTALLSTLIAYVLAYNWVFGSKGRQRLVEFAILVPLWISVLVRAFGWLVLLRPRGFINETLLSAGLIAEPLTLVRNELGVLIGMVHFMVPFAVFPIVAVMRQIDRRVLLAARGLGAGAMRRFVEVFLPLSMPGVVGSFFTVFVFSLGFYITPAILGGGRVVMIAEYIFTQMLQTANWGLGAALAIVLLVLVGLLIWISSKFVRFERLAG